MDLKSYLNSKNPIIDYSPTSNGATTFATTPLTGSYKWWGGVLAHNGKIYGIPQTSTSVLEIDPVTKTTSVFGNLTGSSIYSGGVLAPNGKIYCVPYDTSNILEIDPISKSISSFTYNTYVQYGWVGGVLGLDGKIYCIPFNSTQVLVIDPVTKTTSVFGNLAGNEKWAGGVLAQNGKIYGIAYKSSSVLEITTGPTPSVTTFSTSIWGTYFGGVLAQNGKIYGIPYTRNPNPILGCAMLEIDPIARGVRTFNPSIQADYQYVGGVLSPNGKIYCIPSNATGVLVIDPTLSTVTTLTIPSSSVSISKWAGGVLAENGKIYGIPDNAESVLEISDISIVQRPAKWLLSAYANKF